MVALSPLVLLFGYSVALVAPRTRYVSQALLLEGSVVEDLTFGFAFAAGLLGLWLARRRWRTRDDRWPGLGCALFAVSLLLFACEEIAWGQHIFGFEAPRWFAENNLQGETTIHNLPGLHATSEFPALLVGLGGLAGIWLGRFRGWRHLAVPGILATWFAAIAFMAFWDAYKDFYYTPRMVYYFFDWIDELVEMLIAAAGLLTVWLWSRRDRVRQQAARQDQPPASAPAAG